MKLLLKEVSIALLSVLQLVVVAVWLCCSSEERYLDKDERLLDMVSYWQRLYEEEKKLPENKSYRVAYKVREACVLH